MTTINVSAFSSDFQNNSQFSKIISVMNNSPTLVDAINTFAAKYGNNNIVLGTSGGGTKTNSINGGEVITIDPSYLASVFSNTLGTDTLQQFATAMGHELGHALLSNGMGDIASANTADQGRNIGLTAEGVALTEEYKVAKELGTTMHSGANIQADFDQIAQQYAGDPTQINNAEIAKGAVDYSSVKPSGMNYLTYYDYYRDVWIIDKCTGSPSNIDWSNVGKNDIGYITNPDGSCTVTTSANLQLLNGNTESVSGKFSSSGNPISIDDKTYANGKISQEDIVNQNGNFNIVKYASDGVTQAISDLYDATGKVLKEIVNPSISFADFSNVAASALATQVIAQFLFKNNLPASAAAQAFSNVTVQAKLVANDNHLQRYCDKRAA